MKIQALFVAVLLSVAARAEPMVQVTLNWLNHAEQQCKGCATQVVTNFAGAPFFVGEECREGMIFLKLVARWQGEAIEVSLGRQSRRDEKTFVDDGPAKSVVVRKGETKQIELPGFSFAVSALAAPEPTPDQPAPPKGG